MNRYIVTTVVILLITIFSPLILNGITATMMQRYIYQDFKGIQIDAIIVPAAGYDVMQARVQKAYDIWKINPDTKVILSGKNKPEENYAEVDILKSLAEKAGIDQKSIEIDGNSGRTFETCININNKTRTYAIVSQVYHLDRAVSICRMLGVNALGVVVGNSSEDYLPDSISSFRDAYALIPAIFDVLNYKLFGKL